ncbi:restriction endonuclease subunit S [Pseudomonas sp. EYE_354]|uniref:restriction endonuclease subunit S n=1 Tax=Pseudomonas sp. EYE_354 TaxID=2853449 RepID=UPI002004885A|nr:restriction endonuclease subunit S [Pseudomonas sp. EYE_354]MCK6187794.1 restriction endonuclease subunit S [Pseudomonas sp. EYE_354]
MTFPAYPGYRDSGVEWLGAVPSYWESWKISHAFGELGSGTTPPTSEAGWYEDGTVPWVTTGELREGVIWETKKLLSSTVLSAFSALRLHPAGSLAIAMYGATIGRLGILGVDATTNQACCLLTRPKYLHVKFTFYWLLVFKQSIIDLYASGGGQPNINQEIIANLKVPAPGIPEQTQIARFLDHETARIDALIEEQQRLIELLKEKRHAMISHAVTKGLDPNVPMKDSGAQWLGKVPTHWEVTALKYVVSHLEQGWSPQCDNYPAEDGEWGVLKVGCVNGGQFNSAENKHLPVELEPVERLAIKQGDLLISRANTRELVGSTAVATKDFPRLMLCDKLYRLRLNMERAIPEFLALYLGSNAPRSQIELAASGASDSMQNISQSVVMDMTLSLPPLGEQKNILQFLSDMLKKLDDLITETASQRCLLQERRSALISAAVTGKIDVRGWQPPASAQTPELEQEAV